MTTDEIKALARELCAHAPAHFDLDVLHEAARLAREDPAALTDSMIRHVACYEPHTVLPLLRKRADAIQRCAAQAFAQVQAKAAEQRRAAAPVDDVRFTEPLPAVLWTKTATQAIDPASLDGLTFEALCKQFPDMPVTLATLARIVQFTHDMNDKNKERNAKIAALETRVLELEAEKAVADGKR